MSWVKTACALATATAVSASFAPLLAQWPSYPTAGVPRTPDGKPNLQAPAPRTADGKPDLSGLWRNVRGFGAGAPPPGGGPGVAGTAGGAERGRFDSAAEQSVLGHRVGHEGAEVPMLPWAARLEKNQAAADANSKDHPDAHCLPLHPIQLHLHPQPRKVIQTPRPRC